MLYTQVKADQVKIWMPDSMGGFLARLDTAFDQKTGKQNIAFDYICPNSRRFFNAHDRIVVYKKEKHYL